MARKRRSDSSPSDSPHPPQRRRRSPSPASSAVSVVSAADSTPEETDPTTFLDTLIKKLVRLALSAEYARTPIRRADISAKVLGEAHARQFKPVFAGAQKVLRETFGMELTDLPSREKTTLKDRRNQVSQTAARKAKETTQETQSKSQPPTTTTNNSAPSKSWILTSTLSLAYKTHPDIIAPTNAPTQFAESTYTALYTTIIALISLTNGAIEENKLDRHLRRLNADEYTPLDMSTEKLLARMARDGYVEKRRDASTGEEVVEWVVGPRGKTEVGNSGVAGLVRAVYGFGPTGIGGRDAGIKEDEDDLNKRLMRSLGVGDVEELERKIGGTAVGDDVGETRQRRKSRPRRGRNDSDDDDDDD